MFNFIRRLRWKAYHFCKSNSQPVNKPANGYSGFKTLTAPPPNEHLNAFENDLKFTNVQNTFQQQLKKDVQSIKSSNNLLVFAEKAQIFMNYHETMMKSYCIIILLKHTRKSATKQRRKLIEKQRNLLNLSALMREWNVIPTKVHSLH